jgi:hypothetical protein
MMPSTFASKRPKGLRKLVLSNSPARDEDFVDSYNNYRKRDAARSSGYSRSMRIWGNGE